MKKVIITLMAIITIAFSAAFAGCFGAQEKTYTVQDVSITLTNKFREKNVMGQTACFYNTDEVVTLLKESFTLAPGVEDWTLLEYANTSVSVNNLTSTASMSEDGKYSYFEYTANPDGNEYSYLATCHKSDNAFWLIQFACFSKDYENNKATFHKYASTVTFTPVQE